MNFGLCNGLLPESSLDFIIIVYGHLKLFIKMMALAYRKPTYYTAQLRIQVGGLPCLMQVRLDQCWYDTTY